MIRFQSNGFKFRTTEDLVNPIVEVRIGDAWERRDSEIAKRHARAAIQAAQAKKPFILDRARG